MFPQIFSDLSQQPAIAGLGSLEILKQARLPTGTKAKARGFKGPDDMGSGIQAQTST